MMKIMNYQKNSILNKIILLVIIGFLLFTSTYARNDSISDTLSNSFFNFFYQKGQLTISHYDHQYFKQLKIVNSKIILGTDTIKYTVQNGIYNSVDAAGCDKIFTSHFNKHKYFQKPLYNEIKNTSEKWLLDSLLTAFDISKEILTNYNSIKVLPFRIAVLTTLVQYIESTDHNYLTFHYMNDPTLIKTNEFILFSKLSNDSVYYNVIASTSLTNNIKNTFTQSRHTYDSIKGNGIGSLHYLFGIGGLTLGMVITFIFIRRKDKSISNSKHRLKNIVKSFFYHKVSKLFKRPKQVSPELIKDQDIPKLLQSLSNAKNEWDKIDLIVETFHLDKRYFIDRNTAGNILNILFQDISAADLKKYFSFDRDKNDRMKLVELNKLRQAFIDKDILNDNDKSYEHITSQYLSKLIKIHNIIIAKDSDSLKLKRIIQLLLPERLTDLLQVEFFNSIKNRLDSISLQQIIDEYLAEIKNEKTELLTILNNYHLLLTEINGMNNLSINNESYNSIYSNAMSKVKNNNVIISNMTTLNNLLSNPRTELNNIKVFVPTIETKHTSNILSSINHYLEIIQYDWTNSLIVSNKYGELNDTLIILKTIDLNTSLSDEIINLFYKTFELLTGSELLSAYVKNALTIKILVSDFRKKIKSIELEDDLRVIKEYFKVTTEFLEKISASKNIDEISTKINIINNYMFASYLVLYNYSKMRMNDFYKKLSSDSNLNDVIKQCMKSDIQKVTDQKNGWVTYLNTYVNDKELASSVNESADSYLYYKFIEKIFLKIKETYSEIYQLLSDSNFNEDIQKIFITRILEEFIYLKDFSHLLSFESLSNSQKSNILLLFNIDNFNSLKSSNSKKYVDDIFKVGIQHSNFYKILKKENINEIEVFIDNIYFT